MQFLALDFLSSAQLDHTNIYDFENCRWFQGFLYKNNNNNNNNNNNLSLI